MFDYDRLVGSIYDCAANPELWPDALGQIRDAFDAAYVAFGFADYIPALHGLPVVWVRRSSEWNEEWLERLNPLLNIIPGAQALLKLSVDVAWTQLTQLPEEEFQKTEFHNIWVKPQRLRDCLNINYLKRDHLNGVMSMPTFANREPISNDQRRLAETLSPHIRRAVLINDMTDKGKLALTLYRQVLDQLSVAVFVVGLGRRIIFTNASGDAMLSTGNHVHSVGGVLAAKNSNGKSSALHEAIDRAAAGDTAIGIYGIGVPLIAANGERSAAYVLPITGKDIREEMGMGHCAVFISQRAEQQPMAIEILRTLFDLSPAEARVSTLVAKGEGPAMIAEGVGLSINTVRSHLA